MKDTRKVSKRLRISANPRKYQLTKLQAALRFMDRQIEEDVAKVSIKDYILLNEEVATLMEKVGQSDYKTRVAELSSEPPESDSEEITFGVGDGVSAHNPTAR